MAPATCALPPAAMTRPTTAPPPCSRLVQRHTAIAAETTPLSAASASSSPLQHPADHRRPGADSSGCDPWGSRAAPARPLRPAAAGPPDGALAGLPQSRQRSSPLHLASGHTQHLVRSARLDSVVVPTPAPLGFQGATSPDQRRGRPGGRVDPTLVLLRRVCGRQRRAPFRTPVALVLGLDPLSFRHQTLLAPDPLSDRSGSPCWSSSLGSPESSSLPDPGPSTERAQRHRPTLLRPSPSERLWLRAKVSATRGRKLGGLRTNWEVLATREPYPMPWPPLIIGRCISQPCLRGRRRAAGGGSVPTRRISVGLAQERIGRACRHPPGNDGQSVAGCGIVAQCRRRRGGAQLIESIAPS